MSKIELESSGGLLCDEMSIGKCLDAYTKILLWEGDFKFAKDIEPGDILIGDNSEPRFVFSVAEGYELMYEIRQEYGNRYTVNKSHILTLTIPEHKKWKWNERIKKYVLTFFEHRKNKIVIKTFGETKHTSKEVAFSKMKRFCFFIPDKNIIDISVVDYLNMDKQTKSHLRGYKVPVDFPDKELDFEPYITGVLFGSMNQDEILINKNFSKDLPDFFHVSFKETYGLEKIPVKFLVNSREKRLKLLAGILDAHFLSWGKACEIFEKRREIVSDILYLVGSLGFVMNICKVIVKDEKYYRCVVDGNKLSDIPCVFSGVLRDNPDENLLSTKISVNMKQIGKYYGFTVNGNSRFLLGDFTVTHNTRTMCTFMETNRIPKLKTLICPLILTDMWINELKLFNKHLPDKKPKILLYHGKRAAPIKVKNLCSKKKTFLVPK
jgi:replicative DNA helicase